MSMYNADGYFQENSRNSYSVNNIAGEANDDGSFTVNLGGCDDDRVNCLPLTEGWNYIFRMYRPDQSIIDGDWVFPTAEAVK